jgi:2-phosphosulfolactate phosphatase
VDEAMEYKSKGYLVGAERNVKRCDFADFGNSPFDYTPDHVADKDIVFTTTNGTQAIQAASSAHALVIGAFVNLTSVVQFCVAKKRDVVILCSGWNNKFNLEDSIFAGALIEPLLDSDFEIKSDSAIASWLLWKQSKQHPMHVLERSEHYQRLKSNDILDQVNFCLSVDLVTGVPVLKEGALVLF